MPFLPLNPNVTNKSDEAFLGHIDKDPNKGIKDKNAKSDAEPPRKAHSKVKHKTYQMDLDEKTKKALEKEQEYKVMEEAEKLMPVTRIRSQ